MTASERARVSNTLALAAEEVTHALCPEEVAIFPSRVMAYFRMPKGLPLTTLCNSACRHAHTRFFKVLPQSIKIFSLSARSSKAAADCACRMLERKIVCISCWRFGKAEHLIDIQAGLPGGF